MPKWRIDADHSVAAFAVKHMMITDVHGQTVINQEDFGTAWNMPLENGGLLIGRDVHIYLGYRSRSG